MAIPTTRGDAVRLYLSGAASHGAAQADPALSLGNYRSSTRAGGLGCLLVDAIAGVRVAFVAGANGVGSGRLSATDDDSLTWQAPGGTQGTAVRVLAGEQRVLEDGADPGKFVLVTRATADALVGSMTVKTVQQFNDVLGQANGEAGSGETYRCVFVVNAGGAVVEDLKIWIDESVTNVAIALEEPSARAGGFCQTVADADTAPTGVTFVSPDAADHADVVTVDALLPGEHVGLWVRRDLTSVAAGPRYDVPLAWSFVAIG